MKVLVCAASRHGATADIAERIFSVLDGALAGDQVEMRPPEDVTSVDSYDAVVLGSAVYMGRWLPSARDIVAVHGPALCARPVWLFSSGPIGKPAKPEEDPVDAAPMVTATQAREHRVFSGRLDRRRLTLREKAVVVALRTPDGDFRDWAEIEAWAADIAAELRAATPASAV